MEARFPRLVSMSSCKNYVWELASLDIITEKNSSGFSNILHASVTIVIATQISRIALLENSCVVAQLIRTCAAEGRGDGIRER